MPLSISSCFAIGSDKPKYNCIVEVKIVILVYYMICTCVISLSDFLHASTALIRSPHMETLLILEWLHVLSLGSCFSKLIVSSSFSFIHLCNLLLLFINSFPLCFAIVVSYVPSGRLIQRLQRQPSVIAVRTFGLIALWKILLVNLEWISSLSDIVFLG